VKCCIHYPAGARIGVHAEIPDALELEDGTGCSSSAVHVNQCVTTHNERLLLGLVTGCIYGLEKEQGQLQK
jgi:hypothetical protein